MPESACFDPLEIPPRCGDWQLIRIEEGDLPEELPSQTLISWPQHRPLPKTLPAGVSLEIRSHGGLEFFPAPCPWSLYLESLDPFDLGHTEAVLEAAQRAGCRRVVAGPLPAVEGGAQDYRYRLYSLIRLLCDCLKLKFSIFEPQPRPACERLNQYLASQRGCCRFPI